MYEIILSEQALKQLEKLENNIQERILKVLERIKIRPEIHIIKLVGDFGYKLRVGDYRLILDIDNNKNLIIITKIGHRKNIYKNL